MTQPRGGPAQPSVLVTSSGAGGGRAGRLPVWAEKTPALLKAGRNMLEAALEAQKAARGNARLAGGGLLYWPLSPLLQVTHTGQFMAKKQYIQSVHINISNVHFIHE